MQLSYDLLIVVMLWDIQNLVVALVNCTIYIGIMMQPVPPPPPPAKCEFIAFQLFIYIDIP